MHSLNHLSILGPVIVERGGVAVRGFESTKALALLCYLAAQRQAVTRSHLAELFWEGKTEARGRANLSRVLHNLSSLLPDCIEADRQTLELKLTAFEPLDVLLFDQLASQGDADSLAQAATLYRGDFMDNITLDSCFEFENWLAIERERARQQVAQVLLRLSSYHANRTEYTEALQYTSRLLTLEPWREEAHRQMMLFLALSGQRSAALVQYETCCRILEEELAVEPTEETTALYNRIRSNGEEHRLPPQRSPSSPLPFIGRQEEHAQLVQQWEAARRGQGTLTLIEGEGGIGKTRLVTEVLRYVANSGTLVLSGFCYEFGAPVSYQSIIDALQRQLPDLITRIGPGMGQIWLTDLAQILPEIHQLYPDLPKPTAVAPEIARQRLFEATARFLTAVVDDRGPLVLSLQDLHWADQDSLDLLQYLFHRLHNTPIWFLCTYRWDEAIDLAHSSLFFRRILQQDGRVHQVKLAPLPRDTIKQLLSTLPQLSGQPTAALGDYLAVRSDGNPFILNQMVHTLQEQGVIQKRGDKWHVDEGWLADGLTHDNIPLRVRQMIESRVDRLPLEARTLLRLAAVVGYSFEPALLEEITRQEYEIDASFEVLVDRQLFIGSTNGAYHFSHPMIQQVIYEDISDWQRKRLHLQVANTLEQMNPDANLEQLAYHYSKSSSPHHALPYLLHASKQAEDQFAWDAASQYYLQAEGLISPADLEGQYAVLTRRERVYHIAGKREAQERDLRSLKSLARQLEDPVRQAEVFGREIEWALSTGHFVEGVTAAEMSVELAHSAQRPDLVASALTLGALCRMNLGRHSEAQRWAEEALNLYVAADNRGGRAKALAMLGRIALNQRRFKQAQRYMEETVSEWRAQGEQWELAISLSGLSMIHHALGNYGEALNHQLEARLLATQLGDLNLDAYTLTSLGRIYHAIGHRARAMDLYKRALEISKAIGDLKLQASIKLSRGHTLLSLDQVQEAEADYRDSLALQSQLGIPVLHFETTLGLCDSLLVQARYAEVLDLLQDINDHAQSDAADILLRKGEAQLGLGDQQAARGTLDQLVSALEQSEAVEPPRVQTLWRSGLALQEVGDTERATLLMQQAELELHEQAQRIEDPQLREVFLQTALPRSILSH
jgi:predicted ATPase